MLNKMFSFYSLYEIRILFLLVWICLLFKVDGKVWNEVTACYGSDDDCSKYQMQCQDGTSIVLGKLMYGTKYWLQQCQYGISNCKEVDNVAACCGYNASDTFMPFSSTNMSAIFENCEGKSSCEGWAPRLAITPFSSYVWMQYACVNDKNAADMCQNKTIFGNDLFIRFNASNKNLYTNKDTPQDCNCQISTPACGVAMVTTLVDLDFNLPKLNTSAAGCSASSLELLTQNKTFQCQNTKLYAPAHTFERMTEIIAYTVKEIVSLKNIKAGNVPNGPNYIVLYLKTIPKQPLLVKCSLPGINTSFAKWQCPTTVTTMTDSTQQVSTKSVSSEMTTSSRVTSLDTTSDLATTSSVKSASTSSVTVKSESVQSTISPKPKSISKELPAFTKTFSSKETLKTKSTTKSDLLSVSPSKHLSYMSTKPFVIKSSTKSPSSTKRFSITHSSTRPQNHQSTHSQSTYSGLITTSFTTMSSQVKSDSSATNVYPSSHSDNNSTTTSGHTKRASIAITSSRSSTLSIGNTSYVDTTDKVEQTSSSNLDISSINTDVTTHSSTKTTRKTEDDNKNNNNGLIIGITVAVVVVVVIIVVVVMVCFCLRIKRKEKIRRNYIRNTNIFYSFPEDYNDTENTLSNSSPEMERREPSFSNIPKSRHYESVGNPSPSTTLKKVTSPIYFDQYKIKTLDVGDNDVKDKDILPYSRMPSDSTYVSETSNETIDFVNAKENADFLPIDSNSNVENGGKTVTFDPSIYYAKVRKEGRTKF